MPGGCGGNNYDSGKNLFRTVLEKIEPTLIDNFIVDQREYFLYISIIILIKNSYG